MLSDKSFSVAGESNPVSMDAEVLPAWQDSGTIKVLSLVEATFVTGPAKSLMEFAAISAQATPEFPSVNNVVVTFQRPSSGTTFLESAGRAGLEVNVIREGFAFDPRIVPELRRVIAHHRPHIIQSMNFKSHFLMRLLGIQKRYKWIAFHHGYTWTDLKNSAYNQLDRWSLKKADAVVTVCAPFAKELEAFGVCPERIVVQHNSIRPFSPAPQEQVSQLRLKLGIPDNALVLISVGRLSREKGHIDLIDAMAEAQASFKNSPPLRLVIVGDGPERLAIDERIKERGLSDVVISAGFQSEVAPYYQIADIAVLPSHSEGSPYALLEAMAAGVAVVATTVGGVPEIATHDKTALLVSRNNPTELAASILELLKSSQLRERLSAAARERVLDYDPETYRLNMTELYRRVLSKPAK